MFVYQSEPDDKGGSNPEKEVLGKTFAHNDMFLPLTALFVLFLLGCKSVLFVGLVPRASLFFHSGSCLFALFGCVCFFLWVYVRCLR